MIFRGIAFAIPPSALIWWGIVSLASWVLS